MPPLSVSAPLWETAEFELETARIEDEFGELRAARRHYEAAGEAAREANSRGMEAQAWLGASLIALRAGDTVACGEFATRALGAAREAKQPVLVSDALRNMGNAARETGAVRRALALYRKAVAAARGAGSPEAEAKALNNLGTVCQWLGLLPEAISSMERSLELKERLGLSASALLTRNNLGGCFIAIGRLADAEAQLTRVTEAAGAKQPVVVALAKSNLGDLFVLRGEIERALSCYREAHDDNQQRGIAVQDSHAISGIIRCLLLRDAAGDLAEAEQLLQRFGALSGVDDLAEARRRYATTEAAVLDRAGDPKAALTSARRARKRPCRRAAMGGCFRHALGGTLAGGHSAASAGQIGCGQQGGIPGTGLAEQAVRVPAAGGTRALRDLPPASRRDPFRAARYPTRPLLARELTQGPDLEGGARFGHAQTACALSRALGRALFFALGVALRQIPTCAARAGIAGPDPERECPFHILRSAQPGPKQSAQPRAAEAVALVAALLEHAASLLGLCGVLSRVFEHGPQHGARFREVRAARPIQ